MADDPISAALAPVRERQAKATARDGDAALWIGAMGRLADEDVPRLLAAVDAVLKLADETRAALSFSPADCTSACGAGPCDCSGKFRDSAWDLNPEDLRAAILAALTGREETDGE